MENMFELLNIAKDYLCSSILQLNIKEIVCWIYIVVFIVLFFLSSFGRQLGLREKYIQILLKVFEFGYSRIKKKRDIENLKRKSETDDEEETPLAFSDNASHSYFSWDQGSEFSLKRQQERYHLNDVLPYAKAGISAIVHDDVIPQFVSEELPYWNLLSRTNNRAYEFVSVRLTVFWVIGFIIRYCLLLPLRIIILVVGMILFVSCTIIIGPFPDGSFKRNLNSKICVSCFDFVAGCLSLVATFHNSENIPKSGIAVANHTSPIDSMVLATDNCYDMMGQKHGGLLGFFMTLLSRSSYHIWFDRSESRDRAQVTKRLREHASNPDLPPILIFPEGVCVNNTSVMQFKKGAFEVVDEIHPIAIKFDPRFGDAFWWQDHFFNYVLCMMTSWAIVCDVWYLPIMRRGDTESSTNFANRVKAAIAREGGLLNVSWDGYLKAAPVKAEWRHQHQLAFAQQLLSSDQEENT